MGAKMQNLPSLKILSYVFRNIPNSISEIFSNLWPLLLIAAVRDYYWIISHKEFSNVRIYKVNLYEAGTGTGELSTIAAGILSVIFVVLVIAAGINWIDKEITKAPFKFKIDARFLPTIGYNLFILIIFYMPLIIAFILVAALGIDGGLNPFFAISVFVVFFCYWGSLVARYCLVLPAIAVGNSKTRMIRSWNLTSGYQAKLFILLVFVLFATTGINFLYGLIIFYGPFDQITLMLMSIFGTILELLFYVVLYQIFARLFVFFHQPDQLKNYL
jgi:hypothetical protein